VDQTTVADNGGQPSLVADAYAALEDAIRQGVLPPGYQGSEQEIAAKLNMSSTPVHEATIRLQSEGLVKVLSKRGVFICTISPDDMREIYDVIIACESMAAELLAGLPESERVRLFLLGQPCLSAMIQTNRHSLI
jgi:DNA-binding GntR family transcriptional regulator